MHPALILLAIVGVVILLVVVLAVMGYASTFQPVVRWRLPRIAARLGMSYDPEARGLDRLGCKGLPVLQAGTAVRNLLHGTVGGIERIAVEVKRPNITKPAYFLVLGYRLRGRGFPPFSVEPKPFSVELKDLEDDVSLDEEVAEFLGKNPYRDPLPFHPVEVTGNKTFAKCFAVLALRREDKPAVQEAFTPEVQYSFMVHRVCVGTDYHLEVQGAGEWLAVIYPQTMLPSLESESPFSFQLTFDRHLYEAFAGKKT